MKHEIKLFVSAFNVIIDFVQNIKDSCFLVVDIPAN